MFMFFEPNEMADPELQAVLREGKEPFAPETPNADNEWVGALCTSGVRIGHIDEMNGNASAEINLFLLTKHELLQLVKYWADVAIDLEYFFFLYEHGGSSQLGRCDFAWARVARIADLVGREEVQRAIEEVYAKFAKGTDPEAWHAFRHGTDEEKRAVRDRIQRSVMSKPDLSPSVPVEKPQVEPDTGSIRT